MVLVHSVLNDNKTFEEQTFGSHEIIYQLGKKTQFLSKPNWKIKFFSQMFGVIQFKL